MCSDKIYRFSTLKRFEIKGRQNGECVTVKVESCNKHNTTWKMLCTVFTHSLSLYQKSHSFAGLLVRKYLARTFQEVFYVYLYNDVNTTRADLSEDRYMDEVTENLF